MSGRKRIHLTVNLAIEPNTESDDRIVGYVTSALKSAFRNIRDGSVVTTIYEGDRLIGVDLSGTPSPELEDLVDDMLDKLTALTEVNVTVQHPKPAPPRA